MENEDDGTMTEARCSALRAVYDELCRSHDSVSEFRAKLLALLPREVIFEYLEDAGQA